jgi:hypothetical protein
MTEPSKQLYENKVMAQCIYNWCTMCHDREPLLPMLMDIVSNITKLQRFPHCKPNRMSNLELVHHAHSPNFSATQSSTLIMKISKHLEQLEFTHQALLHSITPSDPIT